MLMRFSSLLFRLRTKVEWVNARIRARWACATTPGLSVDSKTGFWRGVRVAIEPGGRAAFSGTHLKDYVRIEVGPEGRLTAGSGRIGRFSTIAVRESVVLEDGFAMASSGSIRDHDHVWDSINGMSPTTWHTAPIRIRSGAWIGERVSIMRGVILGRNSVAAAGAIVRKPVGDGVIVGGVPARPIGGTASAAPPEAPSTPPPPIGSSN